MDDRHSRTIRLTLEYEGSDFIGWQVQAQGRSVQGELTRALETFLRETVCVVGSGRTDSCTHAKGQVAHFHTASDLPTHRIERALNGLLPQDVAVLSVEDVAPDFHARYSATSKRYRYRISTVRSPLNRTQVWRLDQSLDLTPMAKAAGLLMGEHAFGAFCKQDPVPENLVCRVDDAVWTQSGPEFLFEIEANRFLRHMVRIIVGTSVEIGSASKDPGGIASLLEGGDRTLAGPTAPAHGLCLMYVRYPDGSGSG